MLFHLLHYLTDLTAHAAPDGEALTLLRSLTGTAYGTARLVRLLRRPGRHRDFRVVEPGMTFITPGMAAAGIKATGSVASALIGRYRPTGVPRLGSNEDRAEAYRRLLDASARSFGYAYQFAHLRREAGRAANKVLLGQLPQAWELIGALQGVRLCGSLHVIAAAETLVAATGDLDLNERNADRFQQQAEAVVAARDAFLDVCREDLAYTARWWQVRRRIKERRFLREQAER
ncbi:hypothetical protein [Streptomyces lavendofoliae]|uniref:Uncharacterized protein n=1 Tax=Streptomyces lavendofoliae TaxID=67314 RepID=A0A918I3L5_9ACTN|nr:hypothetical protein [Streptomyces lavendofoliae]GGU66985.1 hypothetical protein GCM10010274_64360 [Streptomyces lavendofoliae]